MYACTVVLYEYHMLLRFAPHVVGSHTTFSMSIPFSPIPVRSFHLSAMPILQCNFTSYARFAPVLARFVGQFGSL